MLAETGQLGCCIRPVALVQVCLMFAQGRQQLRLKRLELVQQLDEVAADFDGTRETAIKVQEWLCKHQSVCAL